MDRARRFLLATAVVSIVGLLLSGAVWIGYRIGQGAGGNEPAAQCAWQSVPEEATPRLLPQTEVAMRCAGRLEPSDAASDGGSVSGPANFVPLEPPDPPAETPAETPTETPADPPTEAPAETRPAKTPVAELSPNTTSEKPTTLGDVSEAARSTPWATPYRPAARSPRLEQAARQADYHTRYGFDLASRKAYCSARAEFVRALRIVAQGLDSEHASHVHSQALSAGLTALDEADDFVPVGSALEGELDLDAIVLGHATPVLKLADRERLTPLEAVRRYVEYAQEQLATAAGSEVAGSMALHALGKLHWSLVDRQRANRPIDDTKAVALFEAATQVCPQNYLALNDLGVLLAKAGQYDGAQRALAASFAITGDPTVQINLAQVYRRLGDMPRAEEAEQAAVAALAARGKRRSDPARPAPPVIWVSPQSFADSYAAAAGPWQPTPVARQETKPAPPAVAPEPVKEASRTWPWDWLPKSRK